MERLVPFPVRRIKIRLKIIRGSRRPPFLKTIFLLLRTPCLWALCSAYADEARRPGKNCLHGPACQCHCPDYDRKDGGAWCQTIFYPLMHASAFLPPGTVLEPAVHIGKLSRYFRHGQVSDVEAWWLYIMKNIRNPLCCGQPQYCRGCGVDYRFARL